VFLSGGEADSHLKFLFVFEKIVLFEKFVKNKFGLLTMEFLEDLNIFNKMEVKTMNKYRLIQYLQVYAMKAYFTNNK
jgi:hypothetical protein